MLIGSNKQIRLESEHLTLRKLAQDNIPIMSKELKTLNNKELPNAKALPKLTRKQQAFVNELLSNPKQSATQAVLKTYDTSKDYVAKNIASENLTKPNVLQHLQANSARAEQKIVELMSRAKKEEVQLTAAKDILDRVHGKATQKVEQTTTGVTLTIDLTSALSASE